MSRKILIVDDDSRLLEALHATLTFADFEVVTGRDGEEGLALCRSEHPDVVVSDYLMPALDGLELWAEIQADPETSGTPFILMTSTPPANAAQLHSVLKKPFEADTLMSAVTEAIQDA
ncbi:MAG TPA: response regulator [Oxalicibacterium sp.]|nr:response regulator [Oxalicibacterium sp.]